MEQSLQIGQATHGFCAAGARDLPALVLLHGIGSNAQSWIEQLQTWSTSRHVIAWNAPGYGASTRLPIERPTTDDYVAALLAFLDAQGVDTFDLVGHSLGGLMAARLAVSAPSRVRRLVLSSPAGGYHVDPKLPLPPNLAARMSDISDLGPVALAAKRAANTLSSDAPPDVLARVQAAMAAVTVEGYTQATWMLAQGDILADAPRITQPTLVVVGSEDRVTKPDGVRAVATAIPGARFELIPGAGHASYANKANDYSRIVGSFVEDLSDKKEVLF